MQPITAGRRRNDQPASYYDRMVDEDS
jgi:hypothetical protein